MDKAKMREAQLRLDRDILKLCMSAGMRASDALGALDAYRRGGSLKKDEAVALGRLSPLDRSELLGARYGADGARVAALIVG